MKCNSYNTLLNLFDISQPSLGSLQDVVKLWRISNYATNYVGGLGLYVVYVTLRGRSKNRNTKLLLLLLILVTSSEQGLKTCSIVLPSWFTHIHSCCNTFYHLREKIGPAKGTDAQQDRVQRAAAFGSLYSVSYTAIGCCSFRICWCTADTWHARRLPFVGMLIKPAAAWHQFVCSNTLMAGMCSYHFFFSQFGLLDIQMEVDSNQSGGKDVAPQIIKNNRNANLKIKFPLK